MRNFIYIDTAKYIENALTSYSDLKRKTKDFTDFSSFEEVCFDPINFYLDPKATRLIYNNKPYVINKNFIDVSNNLHFIILSETY